MLPFPTSQSSLVLPSPILSHRLSTATMPTKPPTTRAPSTTTRPPTAVTGPFFPQGDTATYKDLLLFEERLKMNASMLRRRKGRYEGECGEREESVPSGARINRLPERSENQARAEREPRSSGAREQSTSEVRRSLPSGARRSLPSEARDHRTREGRPSSPSGS